MSDRREPAGTAQTIQALIDQGLLSTFTDHDGRLGLRLTDKGWALAEQLRKETGR